MFKFLSLPFQSPDPFVSFLFDFKPLGFQFLDFFFELVDGVLIYFFGGGLFILDFGLNFLNFFFLRDVGFMQFPDLFFLFID